MSRPGLRDAVIGLSQVRGEIQGARSTLLSADPQILARTMESWVRRLGDVRKVLLRELDPGRPEVR